MIAIVITAYNRADALLELLKSLSMLKIEDDETYPLVISIDNNGTSEVNNVANSFEWKFGPKEVIIHKEKLGLVRHFIWAGDQTSIYEHVVFLEDDLLVSPYLMDYVKQMIAFYKDIDEVAAGSLYNVMLNETTGTRFYQVDDGRDVYFIQHPYWGNIWFKNKWNIFKEYLSTYKENKTIIPRKLRGWKKSFKKIYIQYLIETNRTIVTPRRSLVTNNGWGGLHSGLGLYMYQVPLNFGRRNYSFISPQESLSKYDAYEEIYPSILKKLNSKLEEYDFDVDITGEKDFLKTPYVITLKKVKQPILSFSSLMKPVEQSVLSNQLGDGCLSLAKTQDVIEGTSFYKRRKINDMFKNYYLFLPSFTEVSTFIKLYLSRIINHVLIALRLRK